MEFTSCTNLIVLVTIATIVTLLHLLFRHHGSKGLPPGPAGLPLLGRLPFLNPELHRAFADMARSYGPILSFWLGTKLCVVITSPSMAREVLNNYDSVFANHAVPVVGTISTGGVNILWAPNGPHWKMVRKVAVHHLLGVPVIESFCSLRRLMMHRALEALRAAEGMVASIRHVAHSVTLDIMLGMICEDILKDEKGCSLMKEELIEVTEGIVELYGIPNITDFVPAVARFDLQGLQGRMEGLRLRYDDIFERMKNLKAGREGQEGGAKDFLRLMLNLIEKKDPNIPLEIHHVQAVILDMIAAGVNTISTTVEWAMSELMCKPEAMAKVREELDMVVGREGIFEESHISKVQYLDAVMKETLRLHPVLPLLVPHMASAACQVDGYTVPKGTRIFVNVWAIQRDPSVWNEPLQFKPERFFDSPNKWDYNGMDFDYFPFGSGRRICAGINFSERMVIYMLGSLLHSFNWCLPRGTVRLGLEDKYGIVLKRAEPLVLVPMSRDRAISK